MKSGKNSAASSGGGLPVGSTINGPSYSVIAGYLELKGQTLLQSAYPELFASYWTALANTVTAVGNTNIPSTNSGNYWPGLVADSKAVWAGGLGDTGSTYGYGVATVVWTANGTTLNSYSINAGTSPLTMVDYDAANTRWGGRLGNGQFVYRVGSINGANWSTSSPTNYAISNAYPQLAFGNGYWIADMTAASGSVSLSRTTNLTSFTDISKTVSGFGTPTVRRIVYNSGVWLVLFQGNSTNNPWGLIKSTDDGATWTDITSLITTFVNGFGIGSSAIWLDVVDGKFYLRTLVSPTGRIYEGNATATTWTLVVEASTFNPASFVKANGIWVAPNGGGVMATPDFTRVRIQSVTMSNGQPTYVHEPRHVVFNNEILTIGALSSTVYLWKVPVVDIDLSTQFKMPTTLGTYAKAL